jgi:PDZ domain-containing secreted protein
MPRRRWWIPLLVVAGLISVAVIGAAYIQVPYVAYAPGDARPTSPRISVQGEKTYPIDGQVLFVTVGLPRLTALGWLVGKLDPSKVDVFTEKQVYGDQSESESRQENLKLMTYSKDFAS